MQGFFEVRYFHEKYGANLKKLVLFPFYRVALFYVTCFLFFYCKTEAQNPVEHNAEYYASKYKNDDVMCLYERNSFTFGKGKNEFNDKVVTAEENKELKFISLKRFVSVPYAEFYNKFIQIKVFKRVSQNPGGNLVSEKGGIDRSVTDENIFFDDSRMRFFTLRFRDKGNWHKVNVKKEYSDGKYLSKFFFSSPYPIAEKVLEFQVPEWLPIEFRKMNFENSKIETSEEKKGGIKYYRFVMRDIPAYKEEKNSIEKAYTEPHIIVQIKTFDNKGEVYKGFDKVDDVYNWNRNLFLKAGNNKDSLISFLDKIIQGSKTDIDKIKAVYYWVQDNIRYIAYEDGYSGYIPASAQEVLSKKYGDCKGMANLLTELLKLAGYDAHFSWVGTRHIPYSQSLPALCVNNHAISSLFFGGSVFFLDATESFAPFGENAYRIQGKEVLIEKGDKYEIQKVPEMNADASQIFTKADFILNDSKLTGNVRVEISGNQRTNFHQAYHEVPIINQKEFLNAFLEFGNDNLMATEIKTGDLKNRDIPVVINGVVDFTNTVNKIGFEKYIGIDFFPKSLESFIPDEKRLRGYDLGLTVRFTDEVSLTIPKASKFVDKPDNLEINFGDNEFKGVYKVEGNKITLKKELVIRSGIVNTNEFPGWKNFIESIKEFNRYLITVSEK